jgi:hypothetical protein
MMDGMVFEVDYTVPHRLVRLVDGMIVSIVIGFLDESGGME